MADTDPKHEIGKDPATFSADKQKNNWLNPDNKLALAPKPSSLAQQYEGFLYSKVRKAT
jgi:hypothetical protein